MPASGSPSLKRPWPSASTESDKKGKPMVFLEKWWEGRPWLQYDRDGNKLTCTYCIRASSTLSWTSLWGQNVFLSGSSNFKVIDNEVNHEKPLGHKNVDAMERTREKPDETPAVKGLLSLNREVKMSLLTKIHNIHTVCKMGRPFKDCLYLCDLDRDKGLDIEFTYCKATCCMALLDAVVVPIQQETVSLLYKAKFFSFTVDGTTDLAGIDQESIYLRSCSGRLVTQCMSCVGDPESAGPEDIHAFNLQSMKKI